MTVAGSGALWGIRPEAPVVLQSIVGGAIVTHLHDSISDPDSGSTGLSLQNQNLMGKTCPQKMCCGTVTAVSDELPFTKFVTVLSL